MAYNNNGHGSKTSNSIQDHYDSKFRIQKVQKLMFNYLMP